MNKLQSLIGIAGAVLFLAACGGAASGSGATSPTATTQYSKSDQRQAYLTFSQCMRSNGQPNFPDPVQDANGNWGFPATIGKPIAPAACEADYRQIRSVNQGIYGPASSASLATLQAFASCMRAHGLSDWPDPTSDGHFALPGRYAPPNGNQLIAAPLQSCPHAGIKIELPRFSGRS
jgi:hypothetical protein